MSTAPKEEVMQYLDQMDEGSVIRVLMYVKSLSDQKKNKKSPYCLSNKEILLRKIL